MGEEPRSYFELFKNSPDRLTFAAGAVIFEEGQPGKAMYVVRSGSVKLKVAGLELETVEPGGIFGELAIIDASPRSATAIAATACEVVSIEQARFLYLVQQMPFFSIKVMEVMADRLRRRTVEGPVKAWEGVL
jgi:CRP/FNR family transcriptional regulator, cyclic AMP receptor protein